MADPVEDIARIIGMARTLQTPAKQPRKSGGRLLAWGRVILYEGAEWTAADRELNMLLPACAGEFSHVPAASIMFFCVCGRPRFTLSLRG